MADGLLRLDVGRRLDTAAGTRSVAAFGRIPSFRGLDESLRMITFILGRVLIRGEQRERGSMPSNGRLMVSTFVVMSESNYVIPNGMESDSRDVTHDVRIMWVRSGGSIRGYENLVDVLLCTKCGEK